MKKEIKISRTDQSILSVKLFHIIDCINNGSQYTWAIFRIEATGKTAAKSMLDFEDQVNDSTYPYFIEWDQLVSLSRSISQTIEILLIGSKSKEVMQKNAPDEELQKNCDFYIELVDSSYWIVYSNDNAFLDKIQKL